MAYASVFARPGVEAGPEAQLKANNESVCWWRMAAVQGQISAFAMLGHYYTLGDSGSKGAEELGEAVEFLRQAADAGHTVGRCRFIVSKPELKLESAYGFSD